MIEAKKTDRLATAPLDLLGPVFSQNVPVVTGNDLDSLMSAFGKRCNYNDDGDIDLSIYASSLRLGTEVMQSFEPFDWTQDIYDKWLSKFSTEKQLRMEKALSNLGGHCDYKLLATKELMVKGEVLLKRNDPEWAPRIIYVGSDEYNVITGPIQDELNKRISSAFDGYQGPLQ
jgi:hypothetical protein